MEQGRTVNAFSPLLSSDLGTPAYQTDLTLGLDSVNMSLMVSFFFFSCWLVDTFLYFTCMSVGTSRQIYHHYLRGTCAFPSHLPNLHASSLVGKHMHTAYTTQCTQIHLHRSYLARWVYFFTHPQKIRIYLYSSSQLNTTYLPTYKAERTAVHTYLPHMIPVNRYM